jgi:surfeit locus 1 family protein
MKARTRFIVITLAAVITALVTARLGFWQLDRAAQKSALRQAIDERGRMTPIVDASALASTAEQAQAQHHRPARLQGRWSQDHTVFLDNRQMRSAQPGFVIVTPLVLADGRAVLVQRGWAPRDAQDRARVPAVPTPEGTLTVAGRIAPPPPRLFEFKGGDTGRLRQNLDLDAFARETGLRLAPVSVLQLEASAADGLQRDWPAPSLGLSRHQGYAFQWFGLSALVVILYVWFQFIQPLFRRRGD